MFISALELKLIEKMSKHIYDTCNCVDIAITDIDIEEARQNLIDSNETTKSDFCIALNTLYYCYSVMLTEIRNKRRMIMSAVFEQNPKLSQEKSVLKEKLYAIPEYSDIYHKEELLFNFLEHLENIKNSISYLYKEDEIEEYAE